MRILLNPVWLFSAFLFIGHQILQKGVHYSLHLADSFLDCLLVMPILLGLLVAERRLFFRDNYTLSLVDTIVAVLSLAMLFELVFPSFFSGFTFDPLDFLMYTIGGIVFYVFINKK